MAAALSAAVPPSVAQLVHMAIQKSVHRLDNNDFDELCTQFYRCRALHFHRLPSTFHCPSSVLKTPFLGRPLPFYCLSLHLLLVLLLLLVVGCCCWWCWRWCCCCCCWWWWWR